MNKEETYKKILNLRREGKLRSEIIDNFINDITINEIEEIIQLVDLNEKKTQTKSFKKNLFLGLDDEKLGYLMLGILSLLAYTLISLFQGELSFSKEIILPILLTIPFIALLYYFFKNVGSILHVAILVSLSILFILLLIYYPVYAIVTLLIIIILILLNKNI